MLARLGLIAAMTLSMLLAASSPRQRRSRAARCASIIWDNPPSASIHEEATVSTVMPFMAIFNNLVLFDQHKPLNSHGHHRARARHELGVGRRARPSSPSSCARA